MEQVNAGQPIPGRAANEIIKTETDFDRSEPRALLIAILGIATVIGLVVVILGIQVYFDHIREEATYEKVALPISDDLKALRSQEAEELNSYKYVDRNQGVVQIPINRAMELIAQEAAGHKLTYAHTAYPVKAAGPGAVAGAPGAAPAASGNSGTGANATPAAAKKAQGNRGPEGTVGSSLGRGSEKGSTGQQ